MTPSKEKSQENAKHFANTVFVIGSGAIMFGASFLQPWTTKWLGGAAGEQFPFIAGTLLIVFFAMKRPALALLALEWQCSRHGHLVREGSTVCERCLQTVDEAPRLP